ncbi:MAG: thiamine phosphate synthase [Marmoricola sp.]
MNVPRLLLLTDRRQLPAGRQLPETLRACAAAGLTHVVLREHDLPPARRTALLAALAAIDGLTVLSSRVPEPTAAGLHLAASQPTGSAHPGLVGRSCHTPAEVRRAADEGVDYATLSPYAATASKPGHGPPIDPAWLESDHRVPVLALGGITPDNAASARAAGAHGVAVMGAVMRAAEPGAVVAQLLGALA